MALEEIIELGFDRVLTSGQDASALDGSPLIAQLIDKVWFNFHFIGMLTCVVVLFVVVTRQREE